MPKKATARIGYWRPKKRPISEESEPSEEPSITNDLEAIPEEVAPVPPEAGLSAMSITDGGSNDPPPQESQKSSLQKMKAKEMKALRKLAVVHRRWCKRGRTHLNAEHGGARWKTDSEYQRALDRLRQVDDERAEARRRYNDSHRAAVLMRSHINLTRQAEQEQDLGKKEVLLLFALKTMKKLTLLLHNERIHLMRLDGDFMSPRVPMSTGQQIELLCAHAGLAQAYQWVHLSELR